MVLHSLNDIEYTQILRLSTGFPYLDRAFGSTMHGNIESFGMPCGRIVFASGEPGVGKTRFGIAVIKNINARGGKILVFQGEVPPQEFKQWTGNVTYPHKLFVSDDTKIDQIIKYIRQEIPTFVVIDSANMIDDYEKPSEIRQILDDLKAAVADTGCVCFMIGHLTKDGKMKGNADVAHLVDVECSIIRVHTGNMKSFDGLSLSVAIKERVETNAQYKAGMQRICDLCPGMFRYNIGKNRYGPSGGWAVFRHNDTGIEYLDAPNGLDPRMGKVIYGTAGVVPVSGKKASSWRDWFGR
ncbi:AAA family ATPase [candidate division WWE3 bacterium]|jgi:RecA/RadA recombinase|nr:AAA family ATPase [Candidatus Scalindua sp.]MBT7350580.1 AAA family ATPase [candidate division WWE3 bacterium]